MHISHKDKKTHSFNYLLLILLWIALPEIIFLLINKEPIRFFLNTTAFFSLFLLPAYLYKNHLRLFALFLFPIIILSIINLACIYYYDTPIINHFITLALNTNLQETSELIRGYFWTIMIATTVYTGVYGFLITKIKDNISAKKAINTSLISLLVILVLPFADKAEKTYSQKISSIYYTVFPTSLVYSIKSVYDQYHIVNANESIKNNFKFNAVQQINNDEKQVHVLVIGESASFYHWTASGYNRNTTPRIDTTSNLYLFNNAHASAFITVYAVPIMLTGIAPNKFEDHSKQNSILGAFKEAGFSTYWLSNHKEEGHIKLHTFEADTAIFFVKNIFTAKDLQDGSKLIQQMDSIIATPGNKKFIVIHVQGSHYDYASRYPSNFDIFKPSNKTIPTSANDLKNKQILINSYDNTIIYTDYILDTIIKRLKKENVFSSMLYMSDHGENLLDDNRNLSLHANPIPSKYISWIPFFVWTSDKLKEQLPQKINALKANLHKRNSTENLFYTFTDLVGIHHKFSDSTKSLSSSAFKEKTTFMLGGGQKLYNTDSLK